MRSNNTLLRKEQNLQFSFFTVYVFWLKKEKKEEKKKEKKSR